MDFKSVAQQSVTLCQLMAGREKLSTDDVVDQELTVVEFDFAPKFDKDGNQIINENTGEIENYGVLGFAEFPDKYYAVGMVFTKVCEAWAADYPSPKEASEALSSSGGVKVRFTKTKTKAGRNLTNVEII